MYVPTHQMQGHNVNKVIDGMGWRGFLDVLQTKSGCEEDLTLHFHYYEYERTSPEVVIGILCTQLSLYVLRRR